jgi:putative ABC transport system permease protein
LPASHLDPIKRVNGVQHVSAYSWFQGKYKDEKPENFFARFAVDADVVFDIYPDWTIPADQLAAFKGKRTACVVGRVIADKHHMKVGDRITIVGDIYAVTLELELVGIYDHPRNMETLMFHREYLSELLTEPSQKDMVGTYLMLVDKAENVPAICAAIDDRFNNSPYPTRSQSEKEFGRSFLAFFGNIRLFLAAICGAVTFTILLVSANTVAMSVRERTREMAILRTLGYTPGEILRLVLGEAVLISIFGGIFGLGVGWVLGQGAEAAAGAMGVQGVRWQGALIVMGMAIVIGLFSALVPALVASRKNVVESMRFVG